MPDVSKWIKSHFYTNSWTFASGIKKFQFSAIYIWPFDFRATLASGLSTTMLHQFWRLTLVSCKEATPGLTKFAFCHMFGCPTCAVSVEGCPCPKEIHIPPHVWASDWNARSPRTVAAGEAFPHTTCLPIRHARSPRGLPKDKQDRDFATCLGVRHAEGNGS